MLMRSTRETTVSAKQQKIKELFFEAISIEPVDQRRAFIADVCGNDVRMRTRLGSLLEAHARDETLIDQSAWESIEEHFDNP